MGGERRRGSESKETNERIQFEKTLLHLLNRHLYYCNGIIQYKSSLLDTTLPLKKGVTQCLKKTSNDKTKIKYYDTSGIDVQYISTSQF